MTVAINQNHRTFAGNCEDYGRSTSPSSHTKYALRLFQKTYRQAQRHQLLARLRRCDHRLWHLHPATPLRQTRARQTETVSLDQIKGSTSSSHLDFDNKFRPLQFHTKARWLNIAANQQRHLPSIDLIQVDGVYFVVDGHHRLSVAHALGQSEITANVTAYTLAHPH